MNSSTIFAAEPDAPKACANILPGRGRLAAKLREHVGQAAYGSGQHRREETHIETEFRQGWVYFFLAVEIKEVAESLEGLERHTHRQNEMGDAGRRERARTQKPAKGRKVLEKSQESQIEAQPKPQMPR